MELQWCLLFAVCVCGYPVQKGHNNVLLKHYQKNIPSIASVKVPEGEIWKVTTVDGNLDDAKVRHLRSILEQAVLKATLSALVYGKRDPERTKRDLQKLDSFVRKEKRSVQALLSLIPLQTKPGLKLMLERNMVKGIEPGHLQLVRKTRQGNQLLNKSKKHDSTAEDFSNEIIPLSAAESPAISTTTSNETTVITTTVDNKNFIADLMGIAMPNDSSAANTNRELVTANQQMKNNNNSNNNTFARQEEGNEEDEEEGGGGLGGLVTSFLGSLSTPEGGVDLDAVTGLLGGISTQNDDGSYDFTGLQDTVGSLFGGSEEGGSNVGLFLGGLVGAILRGSAGDDAAKGAGRLTGNLLSALLPGLSAYPTPEEGSDGEPGKTPEGLDSGGFLTGFLSTIISGLGGSSNSNSSGGGGGGDHNHTSEMGGGSNVFQFKLQIIKTLFSVLTKILGASSAPKHHH